MLGRLEMTPARARTQYLSVCTAVFGHPRKATGRGILTPRYKSRYMESALRYVSQLHEDSTHMSAKEILKMSGRDIFGVKGEKFERLRDRADNVRLWDGRACGART